MLTKLKFSALIATVIMIGILSSTLGFAAEAAAVAEPSKLMEFFANFPAWATMALTIFTALSAITTVTPNTSDDAIVNFIIKVLKFVTLNVGKDKNPS